MLSQLIAALVVLLEQDAAQHDRLADAWRSAAANSQDPEACLAHAIFCEGIAQGQAGAALRLKRALEPPPRPSRRRRPVHVPDGKPAHAAPTP